MLESLNLSLSSVCAANCIFCPQDRNKRNARAQKIMPFELAKKIIDEISHESFSKKHQITRIEVGENGDVFLNKEAIKLLRYIKFKLPKVKVETFTNFQYFSEEKAQIILSERLINSFHCNIDASNERDFFIAKGIKLSVVKENILNFIEMRKKLHNESSLIIHVLTLNTYINAVRYHLKSYPLKLEDHKVKNIKDDFKIIKKQWEQFLDPKIDAILKTTNPISWAERPAVDWKKLDYKRYSCPNLNRIKEEAFIAPDGAWYACCYDADNELILGNVGIDNIDKIYSSRSREELIERLEKREFQKIGGPCKTVNCCQHIYYDGTSIKSSVKSILEIKYPYLCYLLRILKNKI